MALVSRSVVCCFLERARCEIGGRGGRLEEDGQVRDRRGAVDSLWASEARLEEIVCVVSVVFTLIRSTSAQCLNCLSFSLS